MQVMMTVNEYEDMKLTDSIKDQFIHSKELDKEFAEFAYKYAAIRKNIADTNRKEILQQINKKEEDNGTT